MVTREDSGRETRVVPIAGRSIVVRKLVDIQLMHLMRYARILQHSDIDIPEKLEAVERMFSMLHKMVVQKDDLDFLLEAEEEGKVEIKDLLDFIKIFQDEEPAKPKVRRGRPAASRI